MILSYTLHFFYSKAGRTVIDAVTN